MVTHPLLANLTGIDVKWEIRSNNEVDLLINRFPALTYRDFRIFWFGQFASLVGTWMQSTVTPFLAYRVTNQPFYLGLVGFAASIPALFLTLPGGVFIERLDKRKTVLVLQSIMMLQAFALAYVTFTGQVTIWHILAATLVLGMANALEITARQAMFGELVDKEVLPNAIALNSMIFNAARVIGPTLTAPFLLLLEDAGIGWAFLANGVSYLFVIVGLLLIRTRPKENNHLRPTLQDFLEGQHFIRKTPIVLSLILMVAIPGFFGFTFVQQIPVFARDVFAVVGEAGSAAAARNSFMVTAQGVGALIAALFLSIYSGIRRKAFLLTVGQFGFALGLLALALSRRFDLAIPAMMLIGWGTVTQLTLTNTLIQLSIPDRLRGRVISTYLWVLQGTAPFGSLFIGWLAQQWGASNAVLVGGMVCLAGFMTVHLSRPAIRRTITQA